MSRSDATNPPNETRQTGHVWADSLCRAVGVQGAACPLVPAIVRRASTDPGLKPARMAIASRNGKSPGASTPRLCNTRSALKPLTEEGGRMSALSSVEHTPITARCLTRRLVTITSHCFPPAQRARTGAGRRQSARRVLRLNAAVSSGLVICAITRRGASRRWFGRVTLHG